MDYVGLLQRAFSNEQKQFQRLSQQGQKFLQSIFFYNVINPIFTIFISAFLWRQSQDVSIVALFHLSMFAMFPIGFYMNGHILRYLSLKRMFFAGALFRAISVAILIFSPMLNTTSIVFFGMCYGLLSGIFWSNRNLLTVNLTTSTNRIYFFSLEFISQTLSSIFVPLLIGLFLIAGSDYMLYTPLQAYYVIAIVTVALSLCLIIPIKKLRVVTPVITHIIHRHATMQWNCARGITLVMGLFNGVFTFLPILMVLTYIGKENTLGIIQSITAVVTGITLYAIARSINTQFRVRLLGMSAMLTLIGAIVLGIYFTPLSMFCFIALLTFSQQLLFTEAYSLIFDQIDRENVNKDERYSYVFDAELFLNVGRVTGIVLFLVYVNVFSTEFAIRYTAIFFGVAQLTLIFLANVIENYKHKAATRHELANVYTSKQSSIQ